MRDYDPIEALEAYAAIKAAEAADYAARQNQKRRAKLDHQTFGRRKIG